MRIDVKLDTKNLHKKIDKQIITVAVGWDNKKRKNPLKANFRKSTSYGNARQSSGVSELSNADVGKSLKKRGYKFWQPLETNDFWKKENFISMSNFYNNTVEENKKRLGNLFKVAMKRSIQKYNGRKNSLATIKEKGSNKPAKDTYQFLEATKVIK